MAKIKVVHYINQFFAGIGGEEKADTPAELHKGETKQRLSLPSYAVTHTSMKISTRPRLRFSDGSKTSHRISSSQALHSTQDVTE